MLTTFLDVTIAGLIMGGIYALIAIGLNIQWGVTRVLNMSHGEFIMLGAFAAYFLFTLFGISPLVSLVICSPFFFIIGLILHRFLFTYLLKTSESMGTYEINSLLAAYGLMFILSNGAALSWGSRMKAYSYLADSVGLFGAIFATNRLVAFVFAVGLCALCYLFLTRTRLGKAIRATALDLNTAQLMGVNVYWVLGICFGLGAMLAAVAGALLSMMFPLTPFMGLPYLVITFIVVVLGGMGNILGSLIGGFVLGLVGSVVTHVEPGLTMVAFYIIFVLMLLARPTGIFGK
ncbi:MAG: branched-chain amino acid ABC transporter permease [Proteobacteria bacterium]|nr:branched-chain amino acid ABC transporter permease [Pseudomonadota bacterium]